MHFLFEVLSPLTDILGFYISLLLSFVLEHLILAIFIIIGGAVLGALLLSGISLLINLFPRLACALIIGWIFFGNYD